ncbi:OmpA family protein [Acidimicrobiia bacterium EGI L10123]|nr:OmpA family protein [Acidimicrobiia bacterium EGI L10123]
MDRCRTTVRRGLGLVAAASLVVAACGGSEGSAADEAPPSASTSAPDTEQVPETEEDEDAAEPAGSVEGELSGASVRLEVAPLVHTDDGTVLTASLTVLDAPSGETVTLGDTMAARDGAGGRHTLSDVRLFAPSTGLLASPATVGGEPATTSTSGAPSLGEGDTAGLRVVFPTLPDDVEQVDVLWPMLGVVADVPVEEGDVAELAAFGEEEARDVEADGATGEASPVVARTSELDGAVRTEQAPAQTLVVLAADVLFALDSAELSPEAQAALARAAAQVQAAGPGPVRITGHTDDQGSDDYNLDLSTRRADAVAAALADVLPPAEFPPQVEGRGEAEPAVEDTTEEARAANRRVELLVERSQDDAPAADASDLPPGGGPTAPGDEGLVLEQSDGSRLRVAAEGATEQGDWLRIDLVATVEDAGPDGSTDLLVDLRDVGLGRQRADASGIGVLDGSVLLLPAVAADGTCACANTLFGVSAIEGAQRRFSVWVGAPARTPDTVTVQLPAEQGRLLDVPVG